MSHSANDRRVVEGFRLPSQHPISANEADWIEILRLASNHSDPRITLGRARALRVLFDTVDN